MFAGDTKLNALTFSDALTEIGAYALYNCDALEAFIIPESVTAIGDYAFSSCDSITEIVIPEKAVDLGIGILHNTGITAVTIKAPIVTLPASTFDSCTKLASVSLPETLEAISSNAFAACARLTKILEDGRTVKHVGSGAFYGCRGLTELIIGTEDTEIGTGTFYQCDGLTEITIPEGIVFIGYSAFADCAGLTNVSFPSTLEYIENAAFLSCVNLNNVTLPNSLLAIGDSAFSGCAKLRQLTIPKSVIYVGADAFLSTPWLRNQTDKEFIVVGDGLLMQYTGMGAETITIPETVKRIHDLTFAEVYTIPSSYIIPSSVEYIAFHAFAQQNTEVDTYGNEPVTYTIPQVTLIGREGTIVEKFSRYEYYTFRELGK